MRWLIVYDIACPRRLRRLAKHAEDAGFRLQRSVFECPLDRAALEAWLVKAGTIMNRDEDSLRCYPLCARCAAGIRSAGPGLAVGPGPGREGSVIVA